MNKQWKSDLKALYQATRQETPPPELDHKIRLAAQKALQHKSPNLKWYLSTAAVILLAVNIVLFNFIPEQEVIVLPNEPSYEPLYKRQIDAATPRVEPAPGMSPNVEAIEKPKLEESTQRLFQEAKRSASSTRKELPQSPGVVDFSSDSFRSEAEVASQAAEPNPASEAYLQAEKISYPEIIPFDVKSLIAGDASLTGHQSAQSLEILLNNNLILKMTRDQQGILIEAYAEAWRWGVYAEWGQSNEGLKNCTEGSLIICDFNNSVQGGFVNNRLTFIRWTQKSEP